MVISTLKRVNMTTYALFLYLSTGILQNATGGPAVVDGFTTMEKCEAAIQAAKAQLKQYDWGKCMKVDK
jgi:hypothetical protein